MYLYIHGFASGPRSRKAHYLVKKFATVGIELAIPDFNQGGFTDFTITRQLQQTTTYFTATEPVTIIGSSLGGWAALLLAQQYPQVKRIILLAPAFGFPELWLERLGVEALHHWQESGSLSVYHHVQQQQVPLHYQFVTDAQQYLQSNLDRNLPTLILHGQSDAVVPIDLSRHFITTHPWAELIEFDSDHSLGNVLDPIWQGISQFCTFLSSSEIGRISNH
jgi:uncharacterized protein